MRDYFLGSAVSSPATRLQTVGLFEDNPFCEPSMTRKRWIWLTIALSVVLVGAGGAYFCLFELQGGFLVRGVRPEPWSPQIDGPTTSRPTLWLLSIGVSRYDDSSLNLRFADADAREIVTALEREKGGRIYKEIQTRLLVNEEVSRESILLNMTTFLNRAGPNDVVAVFLAGHGIQDGVTNSYYFLPYAATPDNLIAAALRMSDFNDVIETLRRNVQRVVLMIDTCHSGALRPNTRAIRTAADLAETISRGEGLFILAAAKPGEPSHEEPDLRNGVFTHTLLEALDGKADADGDGLLKLSELFGYVADRVPRLTEGRQHPYQEMSGTDLVFASVAESSTQKLAKEGHADIAIPKDAPEIFDNRIAVLEFDNDRHDDYANDWMGVALQTAIATELDKVKDLEVYSKDFLMEVAGGKVPSLATAREVGAARAIGGSFTAFGSTLRVDARIVDTQSGLQKGAVSRTGRLDEFFKLEKEVVLGTLQKLPEVQISQSERASIAKENESENSEEAVDALRLLLQGEGAGVEDAGDRQKDETAGSESDRHSGATMPWAWGHALPFAPSSWRFLERKAYAQEREEVEEEILATLEAYRVALETANLDRISMLRGRLSEQQREGLESYFANAENLNIEFSRIAITEVRVDVFAVSYLRRDRFDDRRSGRAVELEVKIETAIVRQGDTWTMRSLGKLQN